MDLLAGQGPGKTKVTNGYCALFINQHIRRLQIAMNDVSGVKKVNSTEQVVQDVQHLIVSKSLGPVGSENLLQIQINVIYHQKNFIKSFQAIIAHATLLIWRYYDIVQFSRKQIIGHFR